MNSRAANYMLRSSKQASDQNIIWTQFFVVAY